VKLLQASVVAVLLVPGFALAQAAPARPPALFEAHSAGQGSGNMDISIRETERRPRASVLAVDIRQVGSSVGASFFLLCSVRKLAKERGGFHHVVKLEETPARGQMLIGFLNSADDPPAATDPAFAAAGDQAKLIELDQFGVICDATK
jgi:hypothetical protein